MAAYPMPLFDLMLQKCSEGDLEMLTDQSEGVWSVIDVSGSFRQQLHAVLTHLADDPARLQRLVVRLSAMTYMTVPVSLATDAFLVQQVGRGQLDDLLSVIAGDDGRWEAFTIRWGGDLDEDGRLRIRDYGDDRAATCRSALLMYALAGKLELLRTVFGVPASTVVEARARLVQVANHTTATPASPSALRPYLARQSPAMEAGGAARLRQRAAAAPNGSSSGATRRSAPDGRDAHALRDLVRIFDEAFGDVARRDANGAEPSVGADAELVDYLDAVSALQGDILDEIDADTPDLEVALQLVATAAAGIDLAERARDDRTAAQLASDAARSCHDVARLAAGDAVAELLVRGAVLWEMKTSHARHRSDREHRDQMHATGQRSAAAGSVRAATRSARAGAQR